MKSLRFRPIPLLTQACYGLVMLLPLLVLLLFPTQNIEVDSFLFSEAKANTFYLALFVLFSSTILGLLLAAVHCFFEYPLKRLFHLFIMLPLAFPAYVLAFIYLGLWGQYTEITPFEIQGELWFLSFILTLSLVPYIYFFSCLGFQTVSQSEIETEQILSAGVLTFFRYNVGPKVFPFLLSAQILVCFETLAEFGAASVINVPVMTTMIYKTWFDLFSFSGAVSLSLKYSVVILLLLFIELFFKKTHRVSKTNIKDPICGLQMNPFFLTFFYLSALAYLFLALVIPFAQILFWSFESLGEVSLYKSLEPTFMSLLLSLSVGFIAVCFSLLLSLLLRARGVAVNFWISLSTVGYSLPGSILAVATYALLLLVTKNLVPWVLLTALVLALVYKFLTVSLRSISETIYCISKELDEISQVMNVSWMKRWSHYIFPQTRHSLFIAFLLVMVEVMKEMPLTLMLSPSEYQTLSIKIFNYTSEGEWLKAAFPSLLLVCTGFISVFIIHRQEST